MGIPARIYILVPCIGFQSNPRIGNGSIQKRQYEKPTKEKYRNDIETLSKRQEIWNMYSRTK